MNLLSGYPSGLTMQEMLGRICVPKTTLFRLLNSLCEMDYLMKNEESGRYFLSRQLLRIGLAALGESNMVELALPPMRRLRDRIKESVMLGVFMDNRVVLLEQVLGTHNFTFLLRPGTQFCLHASAPGKLFLAYLRDPEQKAILDALELPGFNEHTITDRMELQEELDRIRQRGYATDLEEEMYGIHCLAAPIFNQFGQITATIWTSGPSGRLTQKELGFVAEEVKRTARAISASLGYISIGAK